MSHPFRAMFLIFVGLVVGSLLRPVFAQPAQPSIGVIEIGQRLTIDWRDRSVDCTVQEVRGIFVRCATPEPSPFGRTPNYTVWHNTAVATSISVRLK